MAWERAGFAAAAIAGSVYGGMTLLVRHGLLSEARRRFGVANAVTLGRAAIAAVLAGVACETLLYGREPLPVDAFSWIMAALAAFAWLLDGVDGWLARRLGLVSDFGARFDMEVDAFFILALSLLVYADERAGPWLLLAGLLRYLFVAAAAVWPDLAAPLPPSQRRKVICALMGAALVTALIPAVQERWAAILLGIGVLALLWSFGVDTLLLLRQAAQPPVASGELGRMDANGGIGRSPQDGRERDGIS
jgi:phosphatidylglycerophosphate synthase